MIPRKNLTSTAEQKAAAVRIVEQSGESVTYLTNLLHQNDR
jgi:hypothetical protein